MKINDCLSEILYASLSVSLSSKKRARFLWNAERKGRLSCGHERSCCSERSYKNVRFVLIRLSIYKETGQSGSIDHLLLECLLTKSSLFGVDWVRFLAVLIPERQGPGLGRKPVQTPRRHMMVIDQFYISQTVRRGNLEIRLECDASAVYLSVHWGPTPVNPGFTGWIIFS